MAKRTYVQVPDDERGEVKTASGRWDSKVKLWYIPEEWTRQALPSGQKGCLKSKEQLSSQAVSGIFLREQGAKLDGDVWLTRDCPAWLAASTCMVKGYKNGILYKASSAKLSAEAVQQIDIENLLAH
ncbi:MAG: hypothetical protein HRT36_03615 [Alphaproteobacteria bacterium]|nr:hypothetical protein [Alphaproteobacteria bacterium]